MTIEFVNVGIRDLFLAMFLHSFERHIFTVFFLKILQIKSLEMYIVNILNNIIVQMLHNKNTKAKTSSFIIELRLKFIAFDYNWNINASEVEMFPFSSKTQIA